MELAIKDINKLREEIANLKMIESQQAFEIKSRFQSPASIFSTLGSLFASDKSNGVKHNNLFNKDLVSMISKVVLPFTLNKTIFRKSNFITKFLVNIASQRVSSLISQKSIVGLLDRMKAMIPKSTATKKKQHVTPLLISHENAVIIEEEKYLTDKID